jgi:hypothetical protein
MAMLFQSGESIKLSLSQTSTQSLITIYFLTEIVDIYAKLFPEDENI